MAVTQTPRKGSSPLATRTEKDSLGQRELPSNALYGINTARAFENFPFTGRSLASCPDFVRAFAMVKQAAAQANVEIGSLPVEKGNAISVACEELRAGKHDGHLIVDMLEGSGGTSTNMNFNEVIANAAALSAQQPIGDYSFVHPNDHVNMGQSTNDVHPSAMKLALYHCMADTPYVLFQLADAFAKKRQEYFSVLRLGRTCLQDAQPMTYGQLFGGYESVTRRHAEQLQTLRKQFLTLPLGGTAIGTGFGSRPGYKAAVYRHLSSIVGVGIKPAADSFDGMQNMDTCARLSAELRNTANSISKIATDLITLSSGPGGGIGELTLPPVQAGSSIMPGKVNPVIPMSVNQNAFAIAGNDATVSMACHQGMLEINHFEMVVCDRLIDSIHLLTSGANMFRVKCVEGIVANEKISYRHLLDSSALATALVPALGYAQVSRIVRESIAQKRPFLELAIEEGCLKERDLVSILDKSVQIDSGSSVEEKHEATNGANGTHAVSVKTNSIKEHFKCSVSEVSTV
ncbi:L-Aspartase-like protein [Aaosphaeria arxii CBS 175.79]|uniref:L-Aspartase-like protein n=1 Tax=Aaosphaeria arxii CBS 175.79 TaxID=1450172 RepID=A0A6A5X620_9PLEO|nr:L-Aspartase-like protein [Aaosphaeria arxii CBS 175.79]KAF2008428.1 L-Aspartase-like protein [Aaosphaeria arxii CBS 175.79]